MISKIILCVFILITICLPQQLWIETTQEDFADGIFERDLFASHGGTVEFAPRYDLNNDGYLELFVADRLGNLVRLYWGSNSGYSPDNVTLFPSTGGANCDGADLNYDGYPDFIVSHYFEKISIYWGSPTGPNPNLCFEIPMIAWNRQGIFIADYNKDGYLDIATSQEQISGHGAVFWGGPDGFNVNNRTDLPVHFGVHNIEVADLNIDGWLDIVFVEYYGTSNGYVRICWGSEFGFSPSNQTSLMGPPGNHGLSIADLDQDHYIDLITTGWYGTPSYIYWGSATGYSSGNMQVLYPGYCYGGSSVADLNSDGYLDIVYHRGGYGEAYQRIYWGSAAGYSDGNSQGFGYPLESSGGFIADLNYDGHLDIFTNTRTPTTHSYIFWGPELSTATQLPSSQDHHGHFRQIGNVYDREYNEDYISSVFDAGETADWGTIEWDASYPCGTSLLFWVRSGNTPTPDETWSDWYLMSENNIPIPEALNARYLQYKARFVYTNPCYLPALNEVQVTYVLQEVIPASITIEPEVINLKSNGTFTAFIVLPIGYDPYDINLETVVCEGAHAKDGMAAEDRYIAKFDVQGLVGVNPGPAVQFMVTGQLYDGTQFCGYDTVRVIHTEYVRLNCTPNPIRSYSTITVSNLNSSNASVKLYDVSGKLIRDLNIVHNDNGTGTAVWNRKDQNGRRVSAGIYFIKIKDENSTITNKVVVLD